MIIIEDIVETGLTITKVMDEMKKLEPADIKLCSCFLKTGTIDIYSTRETKSKYKSGLFVF